jgi:hypothetical protein
VKVSYDKIGTLKDEYEFKFFARSIKTNEWFSKTNPFIRIFRPTLNFLEEMDVKKIPDKQWVMVHETPHEMDCINPDFLPFKITSPMLNRETPEAKLKVEILNWKSDGKHKLISMGHFSILDLVNHMKFKHKSGSPSKNMFQETRDISSYKKMDFNSYHLGQNQTLEDFNTLENMDNTSMVHQYGATRD